MKTLLFILTLLISQAAMAQNSIARLGVLENLYFVAEDNKCGEGKTRSILKTTLAKETKKSSSYFGVTSQGDLAVIYHDNGETVLEVHICERTGVNGQASLAKEFIIENSLDCMVDQITAGDIVLNTDLDIQYTLKFAPIYVPGTSRLSSLCGGEDDDYMYNYDRTTTTSAPTSGGGTYTKSVINR